MSDLTISAGDARFVGSVPDMYHRYLGPMLFTDYAADLAGRVRADGRSPEILEVAAGTGILTEQLLARHPGARFTITDLNPPMLELGRRRLERAAEDRDVTWQPADATELPFGDGSFDAVVCQFGAMFFPDKPRAAREALRVLRPGGQWLFSVWGTWEENPVGEITFRVGERFFPGNPPEFYKVPYIFADPRALRSVVRGAGFEEPEIIERDRTAESPSAYEAAVGLIRGNPIISDIEARGTVDPEEIIQALAEALAARFGDRPLRFPTRIRVVDARHPA